MSVSNFVPSRVGTGRFWTRSMAKAGEGIFQRRPSKRVIIAGGIPSAKRARASKPFRPSNTHTLILRQRNIYLGAQGSQHLYQQCCAFIVSNGFEAGAANQ